MISEKQRQNMQEANEGVLETKRIEELGDEAGSYRNKIKSICFVCKGVCNATLDFGYYCMFGNICRSCSAEVNNKMRSPESIEMVKRMRDSMSQRGKKKEPRESDDKIFIPDEEL